MQVCVQQSLCFEFVSIPSKLGKSAAAPHLNRHHNNQDQKFRTALGFPNHKFQSFLWFESCLPCIWNLMSCSLTGTLELAGSISSTTHSPPSPYRTREGQNKLLVKQLFSGKWVIHMEGVGVGGILDKLLVVVEAQKGKFGEQRQRRKGNFWAPSKTTESHFWKLKTLYMFIHISRFVFVSVKI